MGTQKPFKTVPKAINGQFFILEIKNLYEIQSHIAEHINFAIYIIIIIIIIRRNNKK